MRISDWSSDVCSSDLPRRRPDRSRVQCPKAGARSGLRFLQEWRQPRALAVALAPHAPCITVVDNRSPSLECMLMFDTVATLDCAGRILRLDRRSEEHTSELQSLMRISYAVFCLKKKNISQSNTK